MVPVLDKDNKPLMPCTEKRARQMMERNKAKAYWQKGFFCIKLLKDPSDDKKQEIVLGIDPGSKREGYTVATTKAVVLNITTDTKNWIKDKIEVRKNLRKTRRARKTPYRKKRVNRRALKKKDILPPSTKVRWLTKINIIKFLIKILPITKINIEEIKAKSKKGKKNWNISFSPLQIGKNYFDKELLKINVNLIKTRGFETKARRDLRGFKKSKKKLDYIWEAHNVDSHSLCEILLDKEIIPIKKLYQINFLMFHRRSLHMQLPSKNNQRRKNGSTVSFGRSRGSIVKYIGNIPKLMKDRGLIKLNEFYYLGGNKENRVSIHDIKTGKRLSGSVKIQNIKILYTNNKRIKLI